MCIYGCSSNYSQSLRSFGQDAVLVAIQLAPEQKSAEDVVLTVDGEAFSRVNLVPLE